jgi:hypothetical protein
MSGTDDVTPVEPYTEYARDRTGRYEPVRRED